MKGPQLKQTKGNFEVYKIMAAFYDNTPDDIFICGYIMLHT